MILIIERYDSKKSLNVEFNIPKIEGKFLLDALIYIKENIDGTLGFRRSCKSGVCGSCTVNINGKNLLACTTKLNTLPDKSIIKPIEGFKKEFDLIVDLSPLFDLLQRVSYKGECRPIQSYINREELKGLIECNHCGACLASCLLYKKKNDFIGPAVLCKIMASVKDERKGNSFSYVKKAEEGGLWKCQNLLDCQKSCPRDVEVYKAISMLRNM